MKRECWHAQVCEGRLRMVDNGMNRSKLGIVHWLQSSLSSIRYAIERRLVRLRNFHLLLEHLDHFSFQSNNYLFISSAMLIEARRWLTESSDGGIQRVWRSALMNQWTKYQGRINCTEFERGFMLFHPLPCSLFS